MAVAAYSIHSMVNFDSNWQPEIDHYVGEFAVLACGSLMKHVQQQKL